MHRGVTLSLWPAQYRYAGICCSWHISQWGSCSCHNPSLTISGVTGKQCCSKHSLVTPVEKVKFWAKATVFGNFVARFVYPIQKSYKPNIPKNVIFSPRFFSLYYSRSVHGWQHFGVQVPSSIVKHIVTTFTRRTIQHRAFLCKAPFVLPRSLWSDLIAQFRSYGQRPIRLYTNRPRQRAKNP